jgi:hypothetical protein
MEDGNDNYPRNMTDDKLESDYLHIKQCSLHQVGDCDGESGRCEYCNKEE